MNSLKIKRFAVTVCFLATTWTYCQSIPQRQLLGATKEQIDIVKTKKLAIIIQVPDNERLERMQKKDPAEAEKYKKYYDDLNANVKEVVSQYWPYNKTIEYISEEKALELYKADSKDYVVLGFVKNSGATIGSTHLQADDLGNQTQTPGVLFVNLEKYDYNGGDTKMFIKPIQFLPHSTSNFEIPMGNATPTKGDIIAGIQCLLLMFQDGKLLNDLKEDKPTAKTKTLLLNKNWLSSKLDEEAIKKAYPGSYQVVDQAEYDKILASKDGKYCYLASLPHLWNKSKGSAGNTFQLRYMSVVIDLATGKLVSFDDDSEGMFDTSRINKKVLKEISE